MATLNFPTAAVLQGGAIYIADNSNDVIRKVSGGIITTYAGTGIVGYNGNGLPALKTNFDDLVALAADGFGGIYELDDQQNTLRKITNH